MPEHMKRREAVYYFRRVVPKDLQAAGEPREICRSLKTRDFADAKERLHKENVRFDEWVRSRREQLHKTRQMDPAYKNALDWAAVEAAEEGDAYAQLFGSNDDNGLPYDQWVIESERRDREQDAAFFEEERRNRTVSLIDLFEAYATASHLAVQTVKQWRAVIGHLTSFLGHDNALRLQAKDLRRWRDHLATEPGPRGKPRTPKTINDSYLAPVRAALAWAVEEELLTDNAAADVRALRGGQGGGAS